MKLFNYLVAASAIFCATSVLSTVVDFTGSAIKGAAASISITATATSCTSGVWTCTFSSGGESATYRTIDDVAVAHINKDGSIYLQEIDVDNDSDNDNWSVELPAWYVSGGLTSYYLIGTQCMFTITPVLTNGTVTDWTMSTKKTTRTSRKNTKSDVATCGSNNDVNSRTGKSGREKTTTTAKGPKPH